MQDFVEASRNPCHGITLVKVFCFFFNMINTVLAIKIIQSVMLPHSNYLSNFPPTQDETVGKFLSLYLFWQMPKAGSLGISADSIPGRLLFITGAP